MTMLSPSDEDRPCPCSRNPGHTIAEHSFDPDFGDPWNPIEQGMYDDDPNPYHGDYSED